MQTTARDAWVVDGARWLAETAEKKQKGKQKKKTVVRAVQHMSICFSHLCVFVVIPQLIMEQMPLRLILINMKLDVGGFIDIRKGIYIPLGGGLGFRS